MSISSDRRTVWVLDAGLRFCCRTGWPLRLVSCDRIAVIWNDRDKHQQDKGGCSDIKEGSLHNINSKASA